MKNLFQPKLLLTSLLFTLLFAACDKSTEEHLNPGNTTKRLDIGLDKLIQSSDIAIQITSRAGGYTATASGKGTIPSGEYAGWKFHIDIEGHYSGIGFATLESGSAQVRMRGERFESVSDPLLQSFCCGEGHLFLNEGEYIFTMTGQVVHGSIPGHNHLFAALATTAGTMNMNIGDQTGTVVIPLDPPHDPGIGLIENFEGRAEVIAD
jgi:hypothetical protein